MAHACHHRADYMERAKFYLQEQELSPKPFKHENIMLQTLSAQSWMWSSAVVLMIELVEPLVQQQQASNLRCCYHDCG